MRSLTISTWNSGSTMISKVNEALSILWRTHAVMFFFFCCSYLTKRLEEDYMYHFLTWKHAYGCIVLRNWFGAHLSILLHHWSCFDSKARKHSFSPGKCGVFKSEKCTRIIWNHYNIRQLLSRTSWGFLFTCKWPDRKIKNAQNRMIWFMGELGIFNPSNGPGIDKKKKKAVLA